MRIQLDHPQDKGIRATLGHDNRSALGWYIEVRVHGRLVEEWDGLTLGEPTTLGGLLEVLVQYRFFSKMELQLGLTQLHFGFCLEEIKGEGPRRAAEIVQQLKQASGE